MDAKTELRRALQPILDHLLDFDVNEEGAEAKLKNRFPMESPQIQRIKGS